MTEIIRGVPFDANEVVLPDGSLGYDNVLYSQDFAEWMQTYFKNGVLVPGGAVITTQLQVTQIDSTHIQINTGNMVVNGRTAFLTSPVNMEIAKAGPNMSRFDRVIVELNLESAVNSFRLLLVQGTMSSSPVVPSITRTEEVYQMSLATVTVGVNGITQIKDDRVDDDLCGISQVLIGVKPPLPVTGDSADNISYDGTNSGLTGTTVQAAIDELVSKDYEKILSSNSWSASGNDFVQTLTIMGLTADMKPIIDVIPDSLEDIEQWAKIWKVETLLNSVKFYATQVLDKNLTVKLKVVK